MTNKVDSISEFGRLMREIRKAYGDSLRDLASKLEISAAFLSAMEIGKKKIPVEYASRIANIYNLSKEVEQQIEDSISQSNQKVIINLEELNHSQREASLSFARKISNADPKLIEKLMKALEEDDQD